MAVLSVYISSILYTRIGSHESDYLCLPDRQFSQLLIYPLLSAAIYPVTGGFMVGAARAQLVDGTKANGAASETEPGVQMVTPSSHLRTQCPIAAEGVGKQTPRWLNFGQRVYNTAPARHAGGRVARRDILSESIAYFAARKIYHNNGESHNAALTYECMQLRTRE